jgi:hypothetical protein
MYLMSITRDTRWRSRNVAGSLPGGGIGIFDWEIFIDRMLSAVLWPSAPNRNEYQEYFLWGKGSRCLGLITLPPSCADCLEIWEPQPSGTLRAWPGLYRDRCTFFMSVTHCRQKLVICCNTTRIFANHQYAQTQTVLSLNIILSNTCALQAFRPFRSVQHLSVLCGAHHPPIRCVSLASAVGREADHWMRGARPPFYHMLSSRDA